MAALPLHHVTVVRTHLEMRELASLRGARTTFGGLTLTNEQMDGPRYRGLYSTVGARWHWRDRLLLGEEVLATHLASPYVHIWVLQAGPQVAGYFELQHHEDGRVEIMYFGLVPEYMGRGIGGWFLTRAVEEAFALGASRVVLHTCTLDAPAALPNYLARGFVMVREETYVEEIDSATVATE